MARTHLIGLLLGTEEDWPAAFEHLLGSVGPIEYGGETHELVSERITNEPFDLRYRPRYRLVIDRLGWWYTVPREWLKKVSLMDDVYLLNNPFTFQAMEKHSAYCAMMRLGLRVPATWLIPHKNPPANERFERTAERYNLPFDLERIAAQVGYPLYMKHFDGGQWVGVTRIRDEAELHAVYDASGERLMHVQAEPHHRAVGRVLLHRLEGERVVEQVDVVHQRDLLQPLARDGVPPAEPVDHERVARAVTEVERLVHDPLAGELVRLAAVLDRTDAAEEVLERGGPVLLGAEQEPDQVRLRAQTNRGR